MTLCNENAPILVNEEMGCNIWLMTVRAPEIATTARPGQFVHVKVPGMEAHILRRPFGVYAADAEAGTVDMMYQVLGRKLPAYLRKGCKHFVLLVEGHSFVAAVFDAGSFNLAAYKKQRRELEELTGLPAIAVLPSVTPYQRRTLVSEGISFVVPGSQLFVPALGAVFAERRAATPLPAPVQELSPAAQLVLLDLIYQGDDAPQQQMTIADRLGFDAMKTSRGVRQLEAAGLVDVTKCGRANMVRPRCAGKVLWEAAQPFLKNPARHEVCWRSRLWRRSIRRTPNSPSASSCSSWATSTATPSPS